MATKYSLPTPLPGEDQDAANKRVLLRMARGGEPKPPPDTPLGAAFERYIAVNQPDHRTFVSDKVLHTFAGDLATITALIADCQQRGLAVGQMCQQEFADDHNNKIVVEVRRG